MNNLIPYLNLVKEKLEMVEHTNLFITEYTSNLRYHIRVNIDLGNHKKASLYLRRTGLVRVVVTDYTTDTHPVQLDFRCNKIAIHDRQTNTHYRKPTNPEQDIVRKLKGQQILDHEAAELIRIVSNLISDIIHKEDNT